MSSSFVSSLQTSHLSSYWYDQTYYTNLESKSIAFFFFCISIIHLYRQFWIGNKQKHLIYIIFFRCDTIAGRHWQSKDRGFEDNLWNRWCLKTKTRTQIANLPFPDNTCGFLYMRLAAIVDMGGCIYLP